MITEAQATAFILGLTAGGLLTAAGLGLFVGFVIDGILHGGEELTEPQEETEEHDGSGRVLDEP